MWTRFMDMSSGGTSKEKWKYIYIEACEKEAIVIFYNRFGHNPNRVSCTCCGEDYSISEGKNLSQITAYERNCAYENGKYVEKNSPNEWRGKRISLKEYVKSKDVKVIYKKDIKEEERFGEVPEEGYVWAN